MRSFSHDDNDAAAADAAFRHNLMMRLMPIARNGHDTRAAGFTAKAHAGIYSRNLTKFLQI